MNQSFNSGLGMRSEAILRDLQNKISHGELATGSKLPSERQLCTDYGVSRGTLRRALSRLANDGWITVRHGAQMVVNSNPMKAPSSSKIVSVMFSMVPSRLAAVQKAALASGYLTCAFPRIEMGWDPAAERSFLEQVLRDHHRGLLAFCTPTKPRNEDLLARLDQAGVRVIHVEHYSEHEPVQNFLLPDYRRAAHLAFNHLHRSGYKNLIFFRMQGEWPGMLWMQRGAEETLAKLRPNTRPEDRIHIYSSDVNSNPDVANETREYIRRLPPSTGIVCTTIGMANETIGFAREVGLRCPNDIGIIGVPSMDYPVPLAGIDTVEFDWTRYLLDALNRVMQPEWPTIREWVQPQIITRGSTKKPAATKVLKK